MCLALGGALAFAALPVAARGQMYLNLDAIEHAAQLTPEMLAAALSRLEEENRQSDMGQCHPQDGEAQRLAASQALPEMDVSLGSSIVDLSARFPAYFEPDRAIDMQFFSSQIMRLSIDLGGETIRLTTGGMHNVGTTMSSTYHSRQIYSLSVYQQQCALPISVAIERAMALEAQLQRAGFTPRKDRPHLLAVEEFARSGPRDMALSTWPEAQEQLAITPRAFSSVSSEWRRGQEEVRVTVHNWGGAANPEGVALIGPIAERSVFEADDTGRKYGVELSLSHETMLGDDLYAHTSTVETIP